MGLSHAVGLSGLPFLRLSLSTLQTISPGTNTTPVAISWDVVSAAGNGWPAPTPPVSTIVLPFAGIVAVFVEDTDFQDSANATGFRALLTELRSNTSTRKRIGSAPGVNIASPYTSVLGGPAIFGSPAVSATHPRTFDPGDTIAIKVIQNSGGNLVMGPNDVYFQYFSLISPVFTGAA